MSTSLVEAPTEYERIIGRVRGDSPGPTLIALGGIHGNEHSGIRAAKQVLDRLERERPPLRGELIALAGNRQALDRNTRYIVKDLNRQWTDEKLLALFTDDGRSGAPEDAEQRELYSALCELAGEANGPVIFLDLHTSSADGPPFSTIGDTLRNRAFAMRFPVPMILGLEEQVDGALLEYMNNQGRVTMGVEAGHHDRESSVEHHEAMLWLALIAARMLRPEDLPDAEQFRDRLREATRDLPRIIEVRHRHAVRPGDGFRMEPGFTNFQPLTRGQLLARDRNGEIRAPESGRILLPLYQGQGDDGFFIGREVRPFWLELSALLRRLRLDSVVHLLPGVRRHPELRDALVVNTAIARIYPLEVFHLLGYRKRRRDGRRLIVSRRRFDLQPLET